MKLKNVCSGCVGGCEGTCTLRQVARAARIREQSEGWVKRNPKDDADDGDDGDDDDDIEHQKGD